MKAAIFAHGRGMFAYTSGRLCSMRSTYDITAGSGNGALLAAFAASEEYDMLHDFVIKTKNEKFYNKSLLHPVGDSSVWKLLIAYLKKKSFKRSVLGTLAPYLEKEISPFYYKYMTENKSLFISIYNLSKHIIELKKIPHSIPYERFSKFLLASVSHPLIFNNVQIGNNIYRSAATIEPLPLSKIMDMGIISEVDIFTNLPNGCLESKSESSPFYSSQLLDENSRYLQLKELQNFIIKADVDKIKYRIFFIPAGLNDVEEVDVNKYFDEGYIASDFLCTLKN